MEEIRKNQVRKPIQKLKKQKKENKTKRGKPKGLKDEGKEMPPSGIWSSNTAALKVILILCENGRFTKTHDAGSRVGENNDNRERRERRSPQEIEFNQSLLAEIANKCDFYVQGQVCIVCMFRKKPINMGEHVELENITGFRNIKEAYKSILNQIKNLLEHKFLRELIGYFSNVPINYIELVNILLMDPKNQVLESADTLIQLAFMKYINKFEIESYESIDSLYIKFTKYNISDINETYEQILLSFEENELPDIAPEYGNQVLVVQESVQENELPDIAPEYGNQVLVVQESVQENELPDIAPEYGNQVLVVQESVQENNFFQFQNTPQYENEVQGVQELSQYNQSFEVLEDTQEQVGHHYQHQHYSSNTQYEFN